MQTFATKSVGQRTSVSEHVTTLSHNTRWFREINVLRTFSVFHDNVSLTPFARLPWVVLPACRKRPPVDARSKRTGRHLPGGWELNFVVIIIVIIAIVICTTSDTAVSAAVRSDVSKGQRVPVHSNRESFSRKSTESRPKFRKYFKNFQIFTRIESTFLYGVDESRLGFYENCQPFRLNSNNVF